MRTAQLDLLREITPFEQRQQLLVLEGCVKDFVDDDRNFVWHQGFNSSFRMPYWLTRGGLIVNRFMDLFNEHQEGINASCCPREAIDALNYRSLDMKWRHKQDLAVAIMTRSWITRCAVCHRLVLVSEANANTLWNLARCLHPDALVLVMCESNRNHPCRVILDYLTKNCQPSLESQLRLDVLPCLREDIVDVSIKSLHSTERRPTLMQLLECAQTRPPLFTSNDQRHFLVREALVEFEYIRLMPAPVEEMVTALGATTLDDNDSDSTRVQAAALCEETNK